MFSTSPLMEAFKSTALQLSPLIMSLPSSLSSPQGCPVSFRSSSRAFTGGSVKLRQPEWMTIKRSGVCCCAVTAPEAASTSCESSTHYSVLGVKDCGSLSEIKSAYKRMVLRYHPDVCPASEHDDCTQKFLEVQRAYEILSDPEKKADYDYNLLHPLFAQAFEMGAGSRGRRTRGSDGVSDAWKIQWEAQLSRLGRQREAKETAPSETWGARMRRQSQQQQQH